MKSFREFISEAVEVQNSTDLVNLLGKGKVISKDTAVIDAKNVNDLTSKLVRWGYSRTHQDSHSLIYKQSKSVVGITYDSAKTKATIVID